MGGESIKPIRKRIHVYFLMTTYEQHNEDSIIFSYVDNSHKKINQEVATYAAKYDRRIYEIIIQ